MGGKSQRKKLAGDHQPISGQNKLGIPLVILFDLVNDQIDFLRVFDPDLAFQVLLSNPISPPALADILVRIVESLEISDLEKWLKTIQKEVPDLQS